MPVTESWDHKAQNTVPDTCKHCQFGDFRPFGDFPSEYQRGECRKNAPVVLADASPRIGQISGPGSHWPGVAPEDWCGEFKKDENV